MSWRAFLRHLITTLLLLFFSAAAGAAQTAVPSYPTRPIRLLVPFAPGGGLDALARIISPKLTEAMGQSWIVDNRPGAAGNLGAEIVTRANPDGHTVLMALSQQLTVNPSLYKLSFSVERDLKPVTMLAVAEFVLVVHPSVQARTLKDFITVAKQKPGVLNYASSGVGTPLHLAIELLKKRAGIELIHVAYKGGGPAVAAVLAGESQVLAGTVSSMISYVTAGRLHALATIGAKRSNVLPDLPTVAESGYPGYEADSWFGLLVPSATPKSIVERIRSESIKALQYPDVQTALRRQGLNPETSTLEELAARVKREAATWAVLIKDARIRAE